MSDVSVMNRLYAASTSAREEFSSRATSKKFSVEARVLFREIRAGVADRDQRRRIDDDDGSVRADS
jgi:hypothetical protein